LIATVGALAVCATWLVLTLSVMVGAPLDRGLGQAAMSAWSSGAAEALAAAPPPPTVDRWAASLDASLLRFRGPLQAVSPADAWTQTLMSDSPPVVTRPPSLSPDWAAHNVVGAAWLADEPIPRIVHQSWKTSEVPPDAKDSVAMWRRSVGEATGAPLCVHVLWTDAAARHFLGLLYPWLMPTYDAYPHAVMRADALRYAAVHALGGVWADLDVSRRWQPLAPLLRHALVVAPTQPVGFSNDFFAAAPRHPLLHRVLAALPAAHGSLGSTWATVMLSTGSAFWSLTIHAWTEDVAREAALLRRSAKPSATVVDTQWGIACAEDALPSPKERVRLAPLAPLVRAGWSAGRLLNNTADADGQSPLGGTARRRQVVRTIEGADTIASRCAARALCPGAVRTATYVLASYEYDSGNRSRVGHVSGEGTWYTEDVKLVLFLWRHRAAVALLVGGVLAATAAWRWCHIVRKRHAS
jgi:hypothetical protein